MSSREQVSPREAQALVEAQGYVYLDVRSVPEFDAGHAPNAYNVPFQSPSAQSMLENPRFVQEVAAALGKSAKLVVVCASGVRSLRAAEMLRACGFGDVLEQHAGMEGLRDPFGRVKEKGHRDEGLPIAIDSAPGHSYAELRQLSARAPESAPRPESGSLRTRT
jgi:rhodanese-related sulfurtransferase